jgi:hypothetical protein
MFAELPKEIQIEILIQSSPSAIGAALQINKHFSEFGGNPLFWKNALYVQFGVPRSRIRNYEVETSK